VSKRAKADLTRLREYFEVLSEDAWPIMSRKFRAAMARIEAYPGIGHRRDGIVGPKDLVHTVGKYQLIYRPGAKAITVMRVLHGAQDLPREYRRR
jgi:plasmid stabilization system protein ParE